MTTFRKIAVKPAIQLILVLVSACFCIAGNAEAQSAGTAMEQKWRIVRNAIQRAEYSNVGPAVNEFNRVKRLHGFVNADYYAGELLSTAETFFIKGNKSAAEVFLTFAEQVSEHSPSLSIRALPLRYRLSGWQGFLVSIKNLSVQVVSEPLVLLDTLSNMAVVLLSIPSAALVLLLLCLIFLNRPRVYEFFRKIIPFRAGSVVITIVALAVLVVPFYFGLLTGLLLWVIIYNLALGRGRVLVVFTAVILLAWPVLLPISKQIALASDTPLVRHYQALNQHSYERELLNILKGQDVIESGSPDRKVLSAFAVGQLLRIDGKNEAAEEYFSKALNAGGNPDYIMAERAAIQFNRGNYAKAREMYADLSARLPSSAELLLNQALLAKQLNDQTSFNLLYEQARTNFPIKTQRLWLSGGLEKSGLLQMFSLPKSYESLESIFGVDGDRLQQGYQNSLAKVYFSGQLEALWCGVGLALLSCLYAFVRPSRHFFHFKDPHGTLPKIISFLMLILPGKGVLSFGNPSLVLLLNIFALLGLMPMFFLRALGLSTSDFVWLPSLVFGTWFVAYLFGLIIAWVLRLRR
jgi:hypothetical protein